MKLMTFNMRINTSRDGSNAWPHRVDIAGQVIRESNAEAIGTQEMRADMIEDLSGLLPEYRWVGSDRGDGESSAIWYRPDQVDLLETGDFMLSETPDTPGSKGWDAACPRICSWALLNRREDGRRYALFNAHLDHMGKVARWRAMALILERMAECRKSLSDHLPLVLMGDMNAYPDERTMKQLSDKHVNAVGLLDGYASMQESSENRKTFHEYQGGVTGQPIDYIFYTAQFIPLSIMIERMSVHGKYPSDHYPVVMDLAFAD